ncbi:MAG: hypothetical protein GY730_09885 [bacterium]|nr:hypothetical protein [bacterium]
MYDQLSPGKIKSISNSQKIIKEHVNQVKLDMCFYMVFDDITILFKFGLN